MKRMLCLLAIAGLVVVGCAKSKPADVARSYVSHLVAKHKGFKLDTSKLKYKVVEQGKDSATVEVSGKVTVKAEIPLVKRGDQWVVAGPEMMAGMGATHGAMKMSHPPAKEHTAMKAAHPGEAEHRAAAGHEKKAHHEGGARE